MRFEMIENFSVTFFSLIFSFCVAAIISAPTSFKRLCNFAPYFSCRKNAVGTTKIFIPTLFQPKNRVFYSLKKWEFTKCSKLQELFVKRKQARDHVVLCLLQYIFSKQKQDRTIPFPMILLCYGSNSGAGSYTSIISRAANQNPIVNACNSCLSEISASAFSNRSNRTFCFFVRVALSSVSSCTTVSSNSPLSVPLDILCIIF